MKIDSQSEIFNLAVEDIPFFKEAIKNVSASFGISNTTIQVSDTGEVIIEPTMSRYLIHIGMEYQKLLSAPRPKSEFSVGTIVNHEFSSGDIDDLMCTALEGGINYWCRRVVMKKSEPVIDSNCLASDYISRGGTLILKDAESEDTWELDLKRLMDGIKKFCDEKKVNPADLIDDHDADDADCIIQYAIFGEQVFA